VLEALRREGLLVEFGEEVTRRGWAHCPEFGWFEGRWRDVTEVALILLRNKQALDAIEEMFFWRVGLREPRQCCACLEEGRAGLVWKRAYGCAGPVPLCLGCAVGVLGASAQPRCPHCRRPVR
jgi:hypothetical protein